MPTGISSNPLKVDRVIDELLAIARKHDGLLDVETVAATPKEQGGRSTTSARAYLKVAMERGLFTEDRSSHPFVYHLVEGEYQQLPLPLEATGKRRGVTIPPFADPAPWTMGPLRTNKGVANAFEAIRRHYNVDQGQAFGRVVKLATNVLMHERGVYLPIYLE